MSSFCSILLSAEETEVFEGLPIPHGSFFDTPPPHTHEYPPPPSYIEVRESFFQNTRKLPKESVILLLPISAPIYFHLTVYTHLFLLAFAELFMLAGSASISYPSSFFVFLWIWTSPLNPIGLL